MRNRVEVGREVSIEHLRVAPGAVATSLFHSLMDVPLRAKAVEARLKVRLNDRLQHQKRGGLDHPVPNGKDPYHTLPLFQ